MISKPPQLVYDYTIGDSEDEKEFEVPEVVASYSSDVDGYVNPHYYQACHFLCPFLFNKRLILVSNESTFVFLVNGPEQNVVSLLTPVSNLVFNALLDRYLSSKYTTWWGKKYTAGDIDIGGRATEMFPNIKAIDIWLSALDLNYFYNPQC